ncbi:MAG: SusC/RagA family TonB-linked outer membrane protein [Bacteroidales bacterium]
MTNLSSSGNLCGFRTHFVRKTGATFLLLLLATLSTFAQQVSIKGKILEERAKTPVIGAVIKLKGQAGGAATDVNGDFSLKVKSLPVTLLVTSVGYKYQEIDVYEAEPTTIYLTEDQNKLNTVVVVGYGTQKRSDFTGSLSSIPAEFKGIPVVSPDRLLQGAVTGVQVTQSSGQPGGGVTIRVRGGTSINAGNEPLYVIDGFPVYNGDDAVNSGVITGPKINPLSSLSPSDIESIDVLKDASSTAIYGSRGANGVILITTKKARKNESSVTYDGYYGIQSVVKKIDLLNAKEWGALKNDALADSGKSPLYTQDQLDQLGTGTNWQSEAFRDAAIQSHSLSILSGTDKTKLLLSGNYFKQDGIIINTGFSRYTGRLNIDHEVNKRFKIGTYLNGSYTHADVAPAGIVSNILSMVPVVPVRDANGVFTSNSSYGSTVANPIATLTETTNETNTSRFLLNGFGEYKIIDGLTAKVLIGTDIINNKQNRYLPSTLYESTTGGQAAIGTLSTINWLNENTLNYVKTINQHTVDVLVGNTQQHSSTEAFTAGSSNFVSDEFKFNNIGSGSVIATPSSLSSAWTLQSFLGRLNYGYDERYLLTLTVRSDGSSRFGQNNKWGTFPSAAVAWNASNEKFLKGSKIVNALKARFSAGQTGNQEIPPYQSLARLSNYPYTFANSLVYGFAPSSYANAGLGWEKTAQYDFGVDASFLANRIQLTSDLYYKQTNDLLLEVPVPYSSGLSSAFQNSGSVENKGLEVGLKTINFTGKFEWTSTLNYTANRNKVLSLGGADFFIPLDPSNITMPSQIVKVGQPLGSFYTYVSDGLFQAGDDFTASPLANTKAGSQKFKDINKDGKITQDGDRTVVGNSQPKFLLSFSNTFRYKGFDLTAQFNSSYGNKVYNRTRAELEMGTGFTGAVGSLRNRWTPTNTNTDVHRAVEDPSVTISDRFIEDGSFIRLKNLTLGYTLPKRLVSKVKIKSARFYVTGSNLITWTKYNGFDPEVSSNGQNTLNSGNDTGAYPASKSVLGGVSVTF